MCIGYDVKVCFVDIQGYVIVLFVYFIEIGRVGFGVIEDWGIVFQVDFLG